MSENEDRKKRIRERLARSREQNPYKTYDDLPDSAKQRTAEYIEMVRKALGVTRLKDEEEKLYKTLALRTGQQAAGIKERQNRYQSAYEQCLAEVLAMEASLNEQTLSGKFTSGANILSNHLSVLIFDQLSQPGSRPPPG